jgi:N-acetylglucosaminyldiphosphoundecaprenol N-acetyl-beta-D-mannosaminyltransferase
MKISNHFGLSLVDVSMTEFIDTLFRDPSGVVVTPNVDHIQRYILSSEFRDLYDKARYKICDSRILRLISYFGPNRINNVIPGSDLIKELFTLGFQGKKVLVVGSSEDDVQILRKKYNVDLEIYVPPMGFIHDQVEVSKALEAIENSTANIILYALGSPQQEKLAISVNRVCDTKLGFCIGASVDFLTGKSKRAPVLIQKLSLEWGYRLFVEPKRMSVRYIKNLLIVPILIFLEILEIFKIKVVGR